VSIFGILCVFVTVDQNHFQEFVGQGTDGAISRTVSRAESFTRAALFCCRLAGFVLHADLVLPHFAWFAKKKTSLSFGWFVVLMDLHTKEFVFKVSFVCTSGRYYKYNIISHLSTQKEMINVVVKPNRRALYCFESGGEMPRFDAASRTGVFC